MKKAASALSVIVAASMAFAGCSDGRSSESSGRSVKVADRYAESSEVILTGDKAAESSGADIAVLADNTYISGAGDAYEAVAGNTGITDEDGNDLEFRNLSGAGGNKFYRFQQTYRDLPVYGRSAVLTADNDDKARMISSNLQSVEGISTEPGVSTESIVRAAEERFPEAAESGMVSEPELCIYTFEDEPLLAYRISAGVYTSFYRADDGEYIASVQNYMDITIDGEEKSYELDIEETDSGVRFCDSSRNIYVNKLDSEIWLDPKAYKVYSTDKFEAAYPGDDTKVAAESMGNLEAIYDYFSNTIGYYSLDGDGAPLNLFFFVRAIPGVGNITDNAFYWDGTDTGYGEMIAICPKKHLSKNLCIYEDVMAHEFTHAIVRHTADFGVSMQSMAMNEAFADILGECAQAEMNHREMDWVLGDDLCLRDLNDLSRSMESGPHITNTSEYDTSIDCHGSSTLISHIAYRINKGVETDRYSAEETRISDVKVMTQLWYTALLQMHADATFADCRTAVEASAELMGLSDAQRAGISKAFDEAGLTRSVKTESDVPEVNYEVQLYADVMVDFAKKYGYPVKSTDNGGYYYDSPMYRLLDFNNDGTPELYLAGNDAGTGSMLINIYALIDDKPVLVYERPYLNPTSVDDYCVVLYDTKKKQYCIDCYQYDYIQSLFFRYYFDGREFKGEKMYHSVASDYIYKAAGPETFNGHSYLLLKVNNTNEDEVAELCSRLGGYYARIDDSAENSFLADMVGDAGLEFAYFGYSDAEKEGDWKWLHPGNSTFENWKKGEPNNEEGLEHYALLFSDGLWNDGKFNRDIDDGKAYIICEFDNEYGNPDDEGFEEGIIIWSPDPVKINSRLISMEKGLGDDETSNYLNYGAGMWFATTEHYDESVETYRKIVGSYPDDN